MAMKTQCLNENVNVVSIPGDLLARCLSFHKLGICGFRRENDGIVRIMFVDTLKPFTAHLPFSFLYNSKGKSRRLANLYF